MLGKFKKWNTRRRLRNAYISYIRRLDSYDCGTQMALQFSGPQNARARVKRLADKMLKLDPDFPDVLKNL